MATFTNKTKNTASYTNKNKAANDLTWDDADFTWDDAGSATLNNPYGYEKKTKNTTSYTNKTKN